MTEKAKPRRFTRPKEEQSGNHRYFTPGWLVRLWADLHRPALSARVVDLGAADFRLGEAFGAVLGYDLEPLHLRVEQRDVLTLERDDVGGWDVSVISNPPFNLTKEFLEVGLHLAGTTGDVSLLLRCGTQQQISWPKHAHRSLLPRRRVQFEISREYYEFLKADFDRKCIEQPNKKHTLSASPYDCPSGYRLGSPGDDHGIFIYSNEDVERCETSYVDTTPYLTAGEARDAA